MKAISSKTLRACLFAWALAFGLAIPRAAGAAVFYSNQFVSGVTMTTVSSLNTTLNSTSSLTHTATFDFGPTAARGMTIAATTGSNNVTPFFQGNVASVSISGLTCGTTYHWAVVVAGTPDNDQTFTTLACPAPAISVSPPNKAYGAVITGATRQQTFTITNTGTANLVVSAVTVSGTNASMFAVSLGTCASLTPTVAAGSNCTVIVTYSPSAAGNKSAALSIASNAGAAFVVAMTGADAGTGSVPTLGEWGMIFLAFAFASVLYLQARQGAAGSPA
jgi:hypothetical protein